MSATNQRQLPATTRGLLGLLLAHVIPFVIVCCHKESEEPYLVRRARLETRLISKGPSPSAKTSSPELDAQALGIVTGSLEEVTFPSQNLRLKAWVYRPPAAGPQGRAPALMLFHHGWGLYTSFLGQIKALFNRDLILMLPMLRGENGNPGHFELFLGEIDDAKAAVNWLALQPYVDRDHIYAFGWRTGGGVCALLSLMDDVPVRHSGSFAGLYNTEIFDQWRPLLPFDRSEREEIELRLLIGNVRWMKRKHFAYLGTLGDVFYNSVSISAAMAELGQREPMLEIIMVPGDTYSSFGMAIEMYLDLIERDTVP